MKRTLSLLFAVLMVFSFSVCSLYGCDNNESAPEQSTQSSTPSVSQQESEEESIPVINITDSPDYANVALGKTYTRSALYPNDNEPSYPDEGGNSMTDGVIASETAKYSDKAFIGFNKNQVEYTAKGYSYITVDLGDIYYVDKFVAHVASSFHLSVGISAPEKVLVYISNDNQTWHKAGNAQFTDTEEISSVEATLTLDSALTARYVEFRFVGDSNWIMVCETEAYGVKAPEAMPYPNEGEEIKFLFVGNSATYYFNVPAKFEELAEDAGYSVDVTGCCVGSAYLSQFADPADKTHGALLRDNLDKKTFDYVVLQDNSNCDYEDSKAALDVLVPLIDETGAKIMLYKRYSSNDVPANRPSSAKRHHLNYTQLSKDFGIDKVSPVADAFLIAAEKYPSLNLYHTDNSHHSDLGAYLIACIMAITYLDIDLDTVSYTAGYDEATVTAVKELARLACEEGYDFSKIK